MSIGDGFSLWVGKVLADFVIGFSIFAVVAVFYLIAYWRAYRK